MPPPAAKPRLSPSLKAAATGGAKTLPPRSPRAPAAASAAKAPTSVVASWPAWKRYTVTGLFATVIISGAIWGATLKMKQEAKAETRKVLEATVDERVLILEQRREYLMKQKDEIQAKLDGLHARMKARESGLSGR